MADLRELPLRMSLGVTVSSLIEEPIPTMLPDESGLWQYAEEV